GTDVDLNTIDGIYDSATGETRIWVTGIGILLYYDGSEWMELFSMDNPIFEDNFNNPNVVYVSDENYNIVSVWGGDNSGLYAFHQKNLLQNILLDNHDMFVKGIGGNSINDLFIVGSYNKIYHFNGEVIKPFHKLEGDGVLLGISQINDHVFAVGETSGFQTKAVVFRGKR
ncbi:MAG: hypothetical protein JXR87_04180, partial [Candidatus Marinimicrobia bacterium]|nr:hypothetical protein [Candidatus Neomarinimicrobiota bacterium]